MGLRQVINLADAPIIRDILSRLADLRDRFARYEPTQALTLAYAREALLRANEALEAVGLPVPPDPGPLTITGTPPTTGTVGQPYSFTPSAAGGAGTKVYGLASGTLLAGLSLNTSTGAVTGTPTAAGTMTGLSVRVTDDTGSASTTPTTVTIAASSGGGGGNAEVVWDSGVVWDNGVTWGDAGTVTPQPATVAVTGPSTIVEGTGSTTPASVAVSGPASIVEGTGSSAGTPVISAAVTGPASIVEGN